ncbi:MAG: alpha-mannosidase, partial [Oscillospiraceae bacterium]|nr:alpha-mannosidase [Oscillospiraceae bacterium]
MPKATEDEVIYLQFSTADRGWDDHSPQGLAFLNGEPVQGVDSNHREVLLSNRFNAGEKVTVDYQAYTNRNSQFFSFKADVVTYNAKVLKLYYDIMIPYHITERLGENDYDRILLEKALIQTINQLDLRVPKSDEFYSSVDKALAVAEEEIYTKLAGHEDVIATCVGHTHIDVAWLWTVEQTREKVVRSFSTVLKLMEDYPNYVFMSSQPQLYKFLKQRYPDLFEKIKQKIKEGRWEAEGGMWLEADCNLTSGESLVRQFLHGKKFFKDEFGVDNKILWLPDVFGYSAALPQILRGFEMEYFMTTKISWNQYNKLPYDTFNWEGIDGSKIFTHFITGNDPHQAEDTHGTTYNGKLHAGAMIGTWRRYQQKELNNDVLMSFGFGDGGGGATIEMLETSMRLEKGLVGAPKVRQATSRQYFDELYERVKDNPKLPNWVGELYLEYHRGTYTSMARNKKANRKNELLWQDVEFFSVWAEQYGEAYDKELIYDAWEAILLNQFHDILPGSSIKDVYDVTKVEYDELILKGKALLEKKLEVIAKNITDKKGIVVFNSTTFDRNDIFELDCEITGLTVNGQQVSTQQTFDDKTLVVAKDVPAKGYQVFEHSSAHDVKNLLSCASDGIETPFYSIKWNDKAQFTSIFDKQAKREVLKSGAKGNVIKAFEDRPLNFDSWDIDVFYKDKMWEIDDVQSIGWLEKGPIRAMLRVDRKFLDSTLSQDICFYAHTRRIDFKTTIDWKQNKILLKAEFPVNVHANEATYDIQFGNVKRPTHLNTSWDAARFEVCAHKWADLSEGKYGVSLLNDCKYGHDIIDGVMRLTLLKSGTNPNPVADQEIHTFTYSLYPHMNGWQDSDMVKEAHFLNIPLYTAEVSDGKDNFTSKQFVSADCENVIVETVKKAENQNGYIVRMYEYQNALTQAT